MILLSIIFAILAIKKICDLKEENIMLLKALSLERQKDSVLKLAVRDNIPASRFLGHRFTEAEAAVVEGDSKLDSQQGSSWTINLSVLWSSPEITVCDMRLLSHILAEEIYNRGAKERQEDLAEKEITGDNEAEEYVDSEEYDDSQESEEYQDELDELLKNDDIFSPEDSEDLNEREWLTEEVDDYLESLSPYDYLQNLDGVYDTLGLPLDYMEEDDGFNIENYYWK